MCNTNNIITSNNKTIDRRKKIKKIERLINFFDIIFNRFYKFHDKIRINRIKYLPRKYENTNGRSFVLVIYLVTMIFDKKKSHHAL